ncbi:LAFA_0D01640g1_1 [Lachancea sp. 'fantastica']|nr:LAFA_0D01640g1_1 [Lachancea sp. 'fantastica']
MRTFIKSHRKSSSVDSSPSKSYSDNGNSRLSNDLGDASPRSMGNTRPSMEKLPSLSASFDSGSGNHNKMSNKNKIFSTRIFKKPNASNVKLGESTTAPTSPFMQSFRNLSSPENPQNWQFSKQTINGSQTQLEGLTTPTIRGTRMHEWGSSSKERSQSVIVLNRNSTSSDLSSELNDPGLHGSMKQRTGSLSSAASSLQGESRRGSLDLLQRERLNNLDDIHEQHPYSSFRPENKKNRNRQARIHSHEDFLNMERNSTLDLSSFSEKFRLSKKEDKALSPEFEVPVQQETAVEKSSAGGFLGLGLSYTQKSSDENASVTSTTREQSVATNDRSFEEGDEIAAGPVNEDDFDDSMLNNEEVHSITASEVVSPFDEGPSDESSVESSDQSSRFSFELAGANGRTASVKYYSKPEPQANVYVDDLYNDEDFDEDMNCFDEDVDDQLEETEFTGRPKNEKLKPSVRFENLAHGDYAGREGHVTNMKAAAAGREVNGYNDLFDISDDDDDPYGISDHNDFDDEQYEISENSDFDDGPNEISDRNDFDNEHSVDESAESQNLDFDSRDEEDCKEASVPLRNPLNSYGDIFDLSDEEDTREETSPDTSKSIKEDISATPRRYSNAPNNIEDLSSDTPEPGLPADIITNHNSATSLLQLRSPFHCSPEHPNMEITNMPLPPPARSQVLKYHDLTSNLDYEVPGATSNLYFINEEEEDKYNEKNQPDDHYLDEINILPEDYNFSDDEELFTHTLESSGSARKANNSFKRTHSFSRKPIAAVMENLPANFKLELKDKVVTFFHSPVNELEHNPLCSDQTQDSSDEMLLSPVEDRQRGASADSVTSPVTPSNSLNRPTPYFNQTNSLSPIQETNGSVDNSPRRNSSIYRSD